MYNHYYLTGVILEHIGQELQKEKPFNGKFILSVEQGKTMLQMLRILTSPCVQLMYINDLCKRYGKDVKTIRRWIDLELLPKGRKRASDTRLFWYASELDEADKRLERYGYIIRRGKAKRMGERLLSFLRFSVCSDE